MPSLSQHYATVTFPAGQEVHPISVDVTVDETVAPAYQATVVLPTNLVPAGLDPRNPTWLGLEIRQDFGNIIYVYEVTADFGGDVSAITAVYGGDVSAITAHYTNPWNIFNPSFPASTVLNARLMLRTISNDYISKETTLELASDESVLLDTIGLPGSQPILNRSTLRSLINTILTFCFIDTTVLEPGAADVTYSPNYQLTWTPDQTAWDVLYAIVTAANMVLYCDEQGKWYLENVGSTGGDLVLNDTDNITAFTSTVDRNDSRFFDYALIEYKIDDAPATFDWWSSTSGTVISKNAYFMRQNITSPGVGGAQSLVNRALTRGETYQIQAISNYSARPKQNLVIEITGETAKTGIIQSVSWSLPSARMSVDIRNLEEV